MTRTLSIDPGGSFVFTCAGNDGCRRPHLEGRLEPSEQARVQATVSDRSFRDLSGTYDRPYATPVACVPERTLYTIRATRGGGVQEVSVWGCSEPPPALGAALGVFDDILARVDRPPLTLE